jgi:hypothetical protein
MSEASGWIVVPARREFPCALLFGPVECQACGVPPGGNSAHADPGLRHWLWWASGSGNVPMFVRTIAGAAFIACSHG